MSTFFHVCFPLSTFINNTGRNGVVSLAYLPFNLTGTNTFIGNNGDSLRVSDNISRNDGHCLCYITGYW